MNNHELLSFLANRKSSKSEDFNVQALHCYGCAHSAASEPPPGRPSGERPCCSCIRNPEREEWRKTTYKARASEEFRVDIDNEGNARVFDAYLGTQYNGGPLVRYPMDNYVTLDQHEQEEFLDKHPEYRKSVRLSPRGGIIQVIEEK